MKNRQIIYTHTLIALLTAIILYICFRPLVNVSGSVLTANVTISGIILSTLLLLLKNIVQYGHFSNLLFQQKLVNFIALAILFVICWVGMEFLIVYIFFLQKDWDILSKIVPARIVFAFLVYGITMALFSIIFRQDNEIIDPIDIPEEKEKEMTYNQQDTSIEIIERIAVKNGPKIEVVPVSEIIYLQAEGDYVMIHSIKGKFLKEQTMKSFEMSLPSDKFVRVHRSNIINVDFIAQIELYNKQSQLLKLKNGAQVRISLSGYKALKKTLSL